MANFNLDITLEKALEEFKSRSVHELAWKTGATLINNTFHLRFLGTELEVSYPEGIILNSDTKKEVSLIERILLLHYFVHALGQPLANKQISYKELPGGDIYIEPFTNRCIRPIIKLFGNNIEGFKKASELLNGIKEKYGDASYSFEVLPRITITIVIWREDEEFPANANILFDATAADYLPTEDYAFLSGFLISKLKSLAS